MRRENITTPGNPGKISKKNVADIIALTPLQEGLFYHYLKDGGKNYYVEQLILEISGEIDIACFKKAWEFVADTNEMLRTLFLWEKQETPLQVILKKNNPRIVIYNFQEQNSKKRIELKKTILARDRNKGFDLTRVPFRIFLFRMGKKQYKMAISSHHILYDGWSNGIILEDFFGAYRELARNRTPVRPEKVKFKEFVSWLRRQDKNKQERFWKLYLEGFDSPTAISRVFTGGGKQGGKKDTGTYALELSPGMTQDLENFVKTYKVTLAALFYCAWGILLQRYTDSSDVIFGTTVSARTAKIKGIEDIVGLFINTPPLRVRTAPPGKINDLLAAVQRSLGEREEFESTPLADIKEWSNIHPTEDLFDSVVVIENYPLNSRLMKGNGILSVRSYSIYEKTHYDLTLVITIFAGIKLSWIYNSEKFGEETAARLCGHFMQVLNDMVENPGEKVSKIDILPAGEKRKILYEFNDTSTGYPGDKTIHRLFEAQVERTPDAAAAVGAHESHEITYRELNKKADRLACSLREQGVLTNSIVGIKMKRSIEMIIGILGILKAGAAYLPIDPDYPAERIDYMLKDSGARVLVSELSELSKVSGGIEVISLSELSEEFLTHLTHPTQLCYVIYTSGSTGKPKGVMIEHRALVNRLHWMQARYPIGKNDVILQKTPFTFDVSVWELTWWAIEGARVCLLIPGGEKDPGIIIDTIERHHVTVMHFVPSMLNAFLEYIGNTPGLSGLSSLRQVICSGEALTSHQVRRFNERLYNSSAVRLANLYGPTEAAIDVSYYDCPTGKEFERIPIGKPIDNIRLFILDKNMNLQPIGLPGQLWIAGAGLARGYLNNPELTAEKFLFSGYMSYRSYRTYSLNFSKKLYKTGDLSRWLADGNIEFLGRMDAQVKIRGFRIEPGEIENHLNKHEGIIEAIVISRESSDGEVYLCAYFVGGVNIGKVPGAAQLREYLSHLLPDYMIPAFFVPVEKIPLTHNGKVDRNALPAVEIKAAPGIGAAPCGETENKLAEIWSQVLGIDKSNIDRDANFFHLGGHSIKAIAVILKIQKEFAVNVSLEEMFKASTLGNLAGYIKRGAENEYVSIEPLEQRDYYELSFNQERLWLLHRLEPGNPSFNMSGRIELRHPAVPDAVKKAFSKIFDRHESSRTAFKEVNGKPVQYAVNRVEVPLRVMDISFMEEEEKQRKREEVFAAETAAPFDLTLGPLARIVLLKIAAEWFDLVFTMHHIICDGWSAEILRREFYFFYHEYFRNRQEQESGPESLSIQYKDFAAWHNKRLRDPGVRDRSFEFWREKLEEGIPTVKWPWAVDSGIDKNEGTSFGTTVAREVKDRLKKLAKANNTTLFIVMLAGYMILLSRLSDTAGQDIACSVISAGRDHYQLQPVVGFFVSSVIVKTRVHPGESFTDFMGRVETDTLEALRHQGYPAALVCEELRMTYPEVPAAFNMLNLGDTAAETSPGNVPGTHFDLEPYIREHPEGIDIYWRYSKAIFTPGIIEYIAGGYVRLLAEITGGKKIRDFGLFRFNPAETKGNLVEPRRAFAIFEKEDIHQSIIRRFKRQAAVYPENIAVKTETRSLTFRELDEISDRAAYSLCGTAGNRPQGAALLFGQGVNMITGILAVLKSGNFYIPLDPSYPLARLIYMIKDSDAKFLITDNSHYRLANELAKNIPTGIQVIDIETIAAPLSASSLSGQIPGLDIDPGQPAYILYTSGSTGVPKGVVQDHRNILHFIRVYTNNLHIDARDRLIMPCTYCFDAAVMDIYGALLNGAALYPFDLRQGDGLNRLVRWLEKEKITIFHSTPTVYRYFTRLLGGGEAFPALRLVVMGGEAVYKEDVETYKRFFPDECLFINGLGPTESTVTLQYFIDKHMTIHGNVVPVGFPVDETDVLLMNGKNEEVPVYRTGEIVFKSDYLALGYLNNPELTNEKLLRGVQGGSFLEKSPPGRRRLYKTGDLGRRLPDGSIEYAGRKDQQVKIRGYRVEIGEIESVIDKVAGIEKSAVVCRENNSGESYLTVFYTGREEIDQNYLLKILRESVPAYMVPRYFVPIEQIPLTPSGKVDRKALQAYKGVCHPLRASYAAPGTSMEKLISAAVMEIGNLDKVGIYDNFFDLGFTSLDIIRLNGKLKNAMGRDIPVITMFRYSTIKSAAEMLSKEDMGQGESFCYNDRSQIFSRSKKGKQHRLGLKKSSRQ
ncbi:MAG: amino acid adenylation domain-containing protein [Candidatus Aminicenantes bacterium]|nr:amino acid adenylation domain-containing protein [Candidatus Aminicenantes bacterium]NIM81792.1 amino acid adenylation domain-containing protein [Candidatus Aminicenantes bacterium]NIN21164.1 amino acid adenylation domain-containing protein [Candidatus Aminicenantes bacterium]NIN44988.1 amino acid adenylation domain-containing protein [Candidatus Aminicenantes bacterium]NIN87802.1 amino acid adenylation domain-containing protein [Candidatus Aminicenantes bacterium]